MTATSMWIIGYGPAPRAGATPVWITATGGPPPASISATQTQIVGYGPTPPSGPTPVWVVADGGNVAPAGATAIWIGGYGVAAGGPPPTYPVNTVLPAVTGTATVGSTLTCSTGTWTNSPTGYAYQWQRNGANISGATSSTYVLVTADGGTSVSCLVTASNASGSNSAMSNAISVSASAWSPASLPGLVVWYDAQNTASITLNGSNVAQWNDQSGNGHNMTQGTAGNQPPYSATGLNGKPSVNFNIASTSTSQQLSTPLAAGPFTSGLVWAFVFADTSGAAGASYPEPPLLRCVGSTAAPIDRWGGEVITGNGSGTNPADSTAPNINSYTSPTILIMICLPGPPITYNEWANGTNVHTFSPSSSTFWGDAATSLILGMRQDGGTQCNGYVGEVIACPTILATDRQKVEGYFAWKWGLQANLPAGHPYKAAPP